MRNRKIWFITCVSKGFGSEIAKAALRSGDKVVGTVRGKPKELPAALLNSPDFLLVRLDVTREKDVIAGVQVAVRHFGGIDVVVNNAGFEMAAAVDEASDAETRRQFDTNVFGLLNIVRATLPDLRSQRSGHIINISAFFGYDIFPGWGLFGATKFAVEGISKGLAMELAPLGIHVTAMAPGLFSTGFPGGPENLAKVVVQLANLENPPTQLPIGRNTATELSCYCDHLTPIFHFSNFKYE
jgi:NAD(P)-dependent dehydrogenase (short-subunit alcohol dehydrogenase family)